MDAERGGSILIVDDEEAIREAIALVLRAEGYSVAVAEDGDAALEHCARQAPDLVICDIFMPKRDGLSTIRELRKFYPAVKVMCLSGGGRLGPKQALEAAGRLGAHCLLSKPITASVLIAEVQGLMSDAA